MACRQIAMGNYPPEVARDGKWTGKVVVDYDRIGPAFAKLPKKKPARVFVCSMTDLFHERVPDEFIDAVFEEMIDRPHLTFLLLTKRPERMATWAKQRHEIWREECFEVAPIGESIAISQWWPPNVWAGVTVENQEQADARIPWLLKVPARRFLSCEPLLSDIDLDQVGMPRRDITCPTCKGRGHVNSVQDGMRGQEWCPECGGPGGWSAPSGISWLIAGGESGSRARPDYRVWYTNLRDQCWNAGIAFFFKRWADRPGVKGVNDRGEAFLDGELIREFPKP